MRATTPLEKTKRRMIDDVDKVVTAIATSLGRGIDEHELTTALLKLRRMESVQDWAAALLRLYSVRRK